MPFIALAARISIDFNGQDDKINVDVSGELVDVITDKGIEIFKLSDKNLKAGIEKYFGKWPTDVYIRSPTPWGDKFKEPGINQVQRHLKPISGKILEISSKPQIVKTDVFENKHKVPTTFHADISDEVTRSFSTTWSKSHAVEVGGEVKVSMNFVVANVSASLGLSYTHTWGSDTTEEEQVTIGSTAGLTVTLEPGKKALAELQADKGVIRAEVEYETILSGNCVVNYETPYKDHHFWTMDINAVVSNAGLETKFRTTEVIEFEYYSNARISIRDYVDKTRVLLMKKL